MRMAAVVYAFGLAGNWLSKNQIIEVSCPLDEVGLRKWHVEWSHVFASATNRCLDVSGSPGLGWVLTSFQMLFRRARPGEQF